MPEGHEVEIKQVVSRGGESTGVPTGGRRRCYAGCPGERFGVRWPDGELTWICTAAVTVEEGTAYIQ
jgi:hypothetical protein